MFFNGTGGCKHVPGRKRCMYYSRDLSHGTDGLKGISKSLITSTDHRHPDSPVLPVDISLPCLWTEPLCGWSSLHVFCTGSNVLEGFYAKWHFLLAMEGTRTCLWKQSELGQSACLESTDGSCELGKNEFWKMFWKLVWQHRCSPCQKLQSRICSSFQEMSGLIFKWKMMRLAFWAAHTELSVCVLLTVIRFI